MLALAPGCICTCRQTGTILYTMVGKADDGIRWKLCSLRVDHRGRRVNSARQCGEGDVVVIREAPTYSAGETIEHDGHRYEVAADLGDRLELITPETGRPLRGGGALRIAAGNTTRAAKADLVLTMMLKIEEDDEHARF